MAGAVPEGAGRADRGRVVATGRLRRAPRCGCVSRRRRASCRYCCAAARPSSETLADRSSTNTVQTLRSDPIPCHPASASTISSTSAKRNAKISRRRARLTPSRRRPVHQTQPHATGSNSRYHGSVKRIARELYSTAVALPWDIISAFALVFRNAPLLASPVHGGGTATPSPRAGRVGVGAMFKSHCKGTYQSQEQRL